MKTRIAIGIAILIASVATGWAAEGYEVLFKGTKSKLTEGEKQQIFNKLGFRLASDKRTIVDETGKTNGVFQDDKLQLQS